MAKTNMDHKLQKKDFIKIIQITDSHLFLSNNESMMGHKNNMNFYDVINKIKNKHSSDTDLIFLTGDLSQDQTSKSYEHITSSLKCLNIPIYSIPGNHDEKTIMLDVFSNNTLFKVERYIELKHWIFIFLNTQKIGFESGFLNQDEISFIKEEINKNIYKNKKIALIMHHHPSPFNSPLIDSYILENHDELWSTIINSTVKMIICGHVHGDYSITKNNILIESAPATCFQFKKGVSDLILENSIGYKIHYFCYNNVHSESEIWMEPDCVN
jgi:3',5'-cyclic-AMP phosphodiesterase